MTRKQMAAEILRSLLLLKKRQVQERLSSNFSLAPTGTDKEIVEKETLDAEQIWKEEIAIVEQCLSPVFRKLLPTPLYCIEELCKDNENNSYWRPLTHTGSRHHELAMKKLSEQIMFDKEKEFRVARYFREVEI